MLRKGLYWDIIPYHHSDRNSDMVLVSATAPELISNERNLDICNGMGSGLTLNRLNISGFFALNIQNGFFSEPSQNFLSPVLPIVHSRLTEHLISFF